MPRCSVASGPGTTAEGRQAQEPSPPTVVGHHKISKGKDHWLSSPKREEIFGPLGVTNIRTFGAGPEIPTQVAVVMDIADLDVVMAAMQRPEMAAAMDHDGVIPETLVLLVEE